ncbi:hypothetical protein CVT25_005674 [Psilocybe cyanescens]|uniref:AB hydrolase-1 domain-containing protein n=1 Tax=Psilocybe cyanescens TaxID=93625 RepID=A0A409VLG6_PSICY|nr:hypothetical protein CVT25_005674 [Psilocybe cyanescens]
MDPSLYITVPTKRGFKYSVYHSKGSDATKPALLLLHGFPSSSYDWRHQVTYFQRRGHSIIVPDMLGYGGTDKPTDAEAYTHTLMAQDMIDVLDAIHGDERVIAIGHDWGCVVVSRLANLHGHRFIAYAFLAVGYNVPNPSIPYSQVLAYTAQLVGYELFGYWSFFAEDGADNIIKDHFDSFFSNLLSVDPEDSKKNFTPTGAFKATILSDKINSLPTYLTQEEYNTQKAILTKNGLTAPLCWYKVVTSSICMEDAKSIPVEKYHIASPVFLAAAKRDPVAVAALAVASTQKFCPNATIKEYDACHWLLWEAKDQVNTDLEEWIGKLSSTSCTVSNSVSFIM